MTRLFLSELAKLATCIVHRRDRKSSVGPAGRQGFVLPGRLKCKHLSGELHCPNCSQAPSTSAGEKLGWLAHGRRKQCRTLRRNFEIPWKMERALIDTTRPSRILSQTRREEGKGQMMHSTCVSALAGGKFSPP